MTLPAFVVKAETNLLKLKEAEHRLKVQMSQTLGKVKISKTLKTRSRKIIDKS